MGELRIIADQYLPIRDVVFNTLREAILTGKLAPGERLMEKRIAEDIGVSRTPIRESLRRLQLEGLVDITPRKGAVVSAISEKDIRNVLEVRAALEALAVKLACRNMTPEQFKTIKTCAEEFDSRRMESDYRLAAELDEAFHNAIYDAAGNDKLIHILSNLRIQMFRFRAEYLKSIKHREKIAREHRELLGALCEKDEKKAAAAAVKHIENQEKTVVEMVKEG